MVSVAGIFFFSQVFGQENHNIPQWIKNNGKWWSEGKIHDSDFLRGIEYLIQNGIVQVPHTTPQTHSTQGIPTWVKNNAKWWSKGLIDDLEFVKGIQYLVQVNIIHLNAQLCDKGLWDHVYHPERLQIVEDCRTISGIIDEVQAERDGDFHIRINLDPQFADMINDANVRGQHGDLVAEVICESPVSQADAVGACSNLEYDIDIPPVGTHVQVTGSYVLDLQHDGWAEIHPVTSLEVIE